jgi:hypothetical protein
LDRPGSVRIQNIEEARPVPGLKMSPQFIDAVGEGEGMDFVRGPVHVIHDGAAQSRSIDGVSR